MDEHDVVRMKESYGNIPKGEVGTIVYIYSTNNVVVEVEFSNRERFEKVETIPLIKLEKVL